MRQCQVTESVYNLETYPCPDCAGRSVSVVGVTSWRCGVEALWRCGVVAFSNVNTALPFAAH